MQYRWWPAVAVVAVAASCEERSESVRSLLRQADSRLLGWHFEDATDTAWQRRLTADTEEALEQVRRAERIEPNNPKVKHRLGICLSLLRRYEEAERAFEAAEEATGPDDLPLIVQDRGLCAMRQGQDDRALAFFERVLEVRPWQPDTRYHMGLIYERRGFRAKALELYTAELNHNNRNSKAWQAYYRLKGVDPSRGRSLDRAALWLAAWVGVVILAGLYFWWRRARARAAEPDGSAGTISLRGTEPT